MSGAQNPPASAPPLVTLIAAVSKDGFISRGKGVPWDLPEDRRYFRDCTSGKWLLVGRVTYDEMAGWFGDRTPLVLTHDSDFRVPGGQTVQSVDAVIRLAVGANQRELMVIGGGQVFAAAMPFAHRLIITWVDDELGSGITFPNMDAAVWEAATEESLHSRREGAPAFRIVTYRRKQTQPPQI